MTAMKTISFLFIISSLIYGVFGDETDTVSVNDGGSVTLHTNLTELLTDDLIVWRFKGTRIAKINSEVNSDPVYEPDERFTDILKMNPQTGDLTITHITSELTGDYQLEINGVICTKAFSVKESEIYRSKGDGEDDRSSKGHSPGVIAGICVSLLLLVPVGVFGVIYCHRTMRHQESRDEEKSTEMQKHLRNEEASNGVVHPVT